MRRRCSVGSRDIQHIAAGGARHSLAGQSLRDVQSMPAGGTLDGDGHGSVQAILPYGFAGLLPATLNNNPLAGLGSGLLHLVVYFSALQRQ